MLSDFILNTFNTKTLTRIQRGAILHLWNREYPVQLSYPSVSAFDTWLDRLTAPRHIFLSTKEQEIAGWYTDFEREGKRWFVIIIDRAAQGLGAGTALLHHARTTASKLNGWVIDHNTYIKKDGTLYLSPLPFYTNNGFEVIATDRLELDTISAVRIRWIKW